MLKSINSRTRFEHIDIARGLGITLVVLGHNADLVKPDSEQLNIIFSFNLPLFFFLSGLFFNPTHSLFKTIVGKADALLKPFVVTLFFVGLTTYGITEKSFIIYLAKMAYGSGYTIPWLWVPLWFLPHLLLVFVSAWCIHYMLTKCKLNSLLQQSIVVFLLLFAGVYTIDWFWFKEVEFLSFKAEIPGLPFTADALLITQFYFLMGYFLKQRVVNFKHHYGLFAVSAVIFALCHVFFDQTIDLNQRRYDGMIISTLQAICGIYMIISLSFAIQFFKMPAKLLATLGSASLFILIFHYILQAKIIIWLSGVGELSGLNVNVYLISTLAMLLAIALPTFLWVTAKKIKLAMALYSPTYSE